MEQALKSQAIKLIEEARRILLFTHEDPDGDSLGSLLAFALALRKLGKEVKAISPEVPEKYHFLPGRDLLTDTPAKSGQLEIIIETGGEELRTLGYKVIDGNVHIFVEGNRSLSPSAVRTQPSLERPDLIVILDTPTLERVGQPYDRSAPLFFEIPLLNIDHHPQNDHFGRVNLVDLTVTSTSELLVSLLEALEAGGAKLLDSDIATCLLTGILFDTASFQNANTTPKSLTIAAQLTAAGARHEEIVHALFRSKPLSTLRLWGRILERAEVDSEHRFLYALARRDDFAEAAAVESELAGLVDELLKSADGVDLVFLLSEGEGKVTGSVRAVEPALDLLPLARELGGGGHPEAIGFERPEGELSEVLPEVIEKVRRFQKERR